MPKACNFIKKETLAKVLCFEFCEIFRNTFSTEHLQKTASEGSRIMNQFCLTTFSFDFFKCSVGSFLFGFSQQVISALKNFAKLPRKHLRQRLFYACHFIKRVSGIGVFYRKRLLLKHSLNRKKIKKQTFQEIHFDEESFSKNNQVSNIKVLLV